MCVCVCVWFGWSYTNLPPGRGPVWTGYHNCGPRPGGPRGPVARRADRNRRDPGCRFSQATPVDFLVDLVTGLIKTRTIANVTNQLRHTVSLAAQGCEALISTVLGMRTQGFAAAITTQDEEVRMILWEIALEQVDAFNKLQRPELRLAMLFSTTLLATEPTDASNRL